MNIDYEKLASFVTAHCEYATPEIVEVTIKASGLLEEVERLRATVKRVEALAESLKAEGCLRGMNNTIRARVGDQITEALKGPQ